MTSTSSDSSTLTCAPFTPPSFNLMDCPIPNTQFMGYNCYRLGDPVAEFDFRSSYNTTLHPTLSHQTITSRPIAHTVDEQSINVAVNCDIYNI